MTHQPCYRRGGFVGKYFQFLCFLSCLPSFHVPFFHASSLPLYRSFSLPLAEFIYPAFSRFVAVFHGRWRLCFLQSHRTIRRKKHTRAYPALLCLEYSYWFKHVHGHQAFRRHTSGARFSIMSCEGGSPTVRVPELDSCRHTWFLNSHFVKFLYL